MLDRSKVLSEIARVSDELFVDRSSEREAVAAAWIALRADESFAERVKKTSVLWPVPVWEGDPGVAIPVSGNVHEYQVAAVDGSQIYPDRHEGNGCFLINVGTVIFRYGTTGNVTFDSVPTILSGQMPIHEDLEWGPEVVNALRQEHELRAGVRIVRSLATTHEARSLLLFDGSLVFWNLESKESRMREFFLPRYLLALRELHASGMPFASYISLPKSRELVGLVKLQLCDFDTTHREALKVADYAVDATIADLFLSEGQRSRVFKNGASVSKLYPDPLAPYFFYLHVGYEIGRVEIPAFVAHNEALTNMVAACVRDQCQKGHGYPICLAESHEQAVVKGADREFFYTALAHAGARQGDTLVRSHKLQRKRRMGV